MTDMKCDLTELRSLAMRKAQNKASALKKIGIPVSSEVFGDLMKASYDEAKAECSPASEEITAEQMAVLKEVCEPCSQRFKVKETDGEAKSEVQA